MRFDLPGLPPADNCNVVAIIRNGQKWIFIFDRESELALLKHVQKLALDNVSGFCWMDAGIVLMKVNELRTRRREPLTLG